MSPLQGDTLYMNRDDIVSTMIENLLDRIPDAYTGEDGVISILLNVIAVLMENLYIAQQLLSEDMFILTANALALERYGEQFDIPLKQGDQAQGSLVFAGTGGLYIPIGSTASYNPGGGIEPLYFETTIDGYLPNPGVPTAPTAADRGVGGNLNGTYEYKVSFYTAQGETVPGADGNAVTVVNSQMNLSNIPLGGPGTIGRNIYRLKNGGDQGKVIVIPNNTATTAIDNIVDLGGMGLPLLVSTAERISLAAQAEDFGMDYNVQANSVTEVADVPDGVTDVYNPTPFIGGTSPEDYEDYRARLIAAVRAPGSGSAEDLISWAEAVDGVDTATVFQNDNMGTPAAGHVTVRISGPNGVIPGSDVVQNVLDALNAEDIANITIHVTTFTAVSTDVTISTTLDTNYALADVQPAAVSAIQDYINGLPVGGTLRRNGIVDAVFGLPGILDLSVTLPGSDQTTPATSKRVPGTITVN
jgi:uncharacterized phage protein gp47/JayE